MNCIWSFWVISECTRIVTHIHTHTIKKIENFINSEVSKRENKASTCLYITSTKEKINKKDSYQINKNMFTSHIRRQMSSLTFYKWENWSPWVSVAWSHSQSKFAPQIWLKCSPSLVPMLSCYKHFLSPRNDLLLQIHPIRLAGMSWRLFKS